MRGAVTAALALLLLGGGPAETAWAQEPAKPAPSAPEYLFLNHRSTGAMAKELEAAGRQGFVIHSASFQSMLMKRGEPTPRVYRLVATTRESTLTKELNALGAQSFRIVPFSVMQFADEWVVALEQQPQGGRFTYDVVKGDDQLEGKLNALRRQGGILVGVAGKLPGQLSMTAPPPVLIVERAEGTAPEAAVADHRYRVALTATSSGLQKDVTALAAKGYEPIGSGSYLTIVMEHAPEATRGAYDCQMVAAKRLKTVEQELNDLGSTGYRAIPKAMLAYGIEPVIFLGRTPGATDSFHYTLLKADSKTIDADLRRQAAEGYAPVGLIGGGLLILERAGSPKM